MAITFKQAVAPWSNSSPATSGSFTPSAAGDFLAIFVQDGAGSSTPVFSGTGGGAYSNVGASVALASARLSGGQNKTETGAAQTCTVTGAGGAFRCWLVDYQGVGAAGSFAAIQRITPGTGVGAILSTAVVVPAGAVLLTVCIDVTQAVNLPSASNGTQRQQTSIGGQGFAISELAGTGASVQAAFTSATSGATSTFNIVQMILTSSADVSGASLSILDRPGLKLGTPLSRLRFGRFDSIDPHAAPPTTTITVEDAWDWSVDETVVEATPGSFQQADLVASQIVEDAWDHFATDDDDQTADDFYQLVDVVVPSTQYYGEEAEWFEQEADELLIPDDQISPPDDALATDGWDHFQAEDDEQASLDQALTFPDALALDDPYDWSQDDDDSAPIDQHALIDLAQVPGPEDAFDHFVTDEDDYATSDDVALIENLSPVEDAWDHWLTDDDDQVDVVEFTLQSIPTSQLQYYGEEAELLDQDSDEYSVSDDWLGLDTFANLSEDAWDHFTADDDAPVVIDDAQTLPDALAFSDEWDHFATDDDEQWSQDETSQPRLIEQSADDAWDHFQVDDESAWLDDQTVATTPANPQLCLEDAWDHFLTDDSDDYYVADDYALIFGAVTGLMAGIAICGGLSFGPCWGPIPLPPRGYDPRFFNGSNAWLGYRTASGGGIW